MIRWLHRLENAFLILVISLMVCLPLIQIVSRTLALPSPLWIDSAVRLLVLWLCMAGAMLATREKAHIRIDILHRLLDKQLATLLMRLGHMIAALACAMLAWSTAQLTWIDYQDQVTAFMQIPLWLCESIIPFSFLVMSLRFGLRSLLGDREC